MLNHLRKCVQVKYVYDMYYQYSKPGVHDKYLQDERYMHNTNKS